MFNYYCILSSVSSLISPFGRQKPVYRLGANFPTASEVGIPAAQYVNARRQKSVYRRHGMSAPEVGIPTVFSNAYWHRNARVIEIQTRQQLKNNFSYENEFL